MSNPNLNLKTCLHLKAGPVNVTVLSKNWMQLQLILTSALKHPNPFWPLGGSGHGQQTLTCYYYLLPTYLYGEQLLKHTLPVVMEPLLEVSHCLLALLLVSTNSWGHIGLFVPQCLLLHWEGTTNSLLCTYEQHNTRISSQTSSYSNLQRVQAAVEAACRKKDITSFHVDIFIGVL